MSDSIDRVFVHAFSTVKKIPRTGSARPPPTDRLMLYGLYKQAIEGDVRGVMACPSMPPLTDRGITDTERQQIDAERLKWDAWASQEGLSKTEAKRRYISTLIATMHKYASQTAEGRELVAELEFVWDQVRANESAGSGEGDEREEGRSYTGEGRVRDRERDRRRDDPVAGDGSGLRILCPISEADADEQLSSSCSTNADPPRSPIDDSRFPNPSNPKLNRQWRRRIENAITQLSVEVAALREQLEIKRFGRRRGWWPWTTCLFWTAVKHLVADALLLGVLVLWGRRSGDQRLEEGVGIVARVVMERLRGWRIPLIRGKRRELQDERWR